MEGMEKKDGGELYAKSVRAGKRTYFFDVKATRGNELYLTVTESKKRFSDDGKFTYEKHKIFLYREDFEKFMDALQESVNYVNENSPEREEREESPVEAYSETTEFSNVSFEDLDK